MSFPSLPNEVILLILSQLKYENEINALCRTTRWLHALLNPILYKRSLTQQNGGYTLEWAAINGSTLTARMILDAGAPPNACGGKPWQPFALAAFYGSSEIIRLLYEHGIDPCSTKNDWDNHLHGKKGIRNWEEGHPLSMAASSGHVNVVNLLLEYGVCPDLPTGSLQKRTALHRAAENGHLDVVRVLADAGSAINAQDGNGATPLALAAQEDYLDIVEFLLSRGANPNIATEDRGTSLCMASRTGNIDIVRCLIDHGATPNPSYPDGMKPLFQLSHAAEAGHGDIVDLLLTRFDYIKSSTEPYQQGILLCVAAITGRTTLLTNLLTKHNYDPNLRVTNERIFTPKRSYFWAPTMPLTWAAERNQPAAVDILLSHGASIMPPTDKSPNNSRTNDELPALLRAIHNGHKEVVEIILAHGANPNDPAGEALSTAKSTPSIFSLLLSYNADPLIALPNRNLLADVLDWGNVDTLRILLDHPKGKELVTDPILGGDLFNQCLVPLFSAALSGGEDVLRFLLDRGLVAAPKNIHRETVWQYISVAVSHGRISLVRLLLDLGLHIHAGDNTVYLLMQAMKADEDPEGLLDLLLHNGCRIDDTDALGRTAFIRAAGHGHQDAMRWLLKQGANLLVAFEGETALSVAVREGQLGAVAIILWAFDDRGLTLGEVEGALKRAEENALELDRPNIAIVLHRFYWRKRYPVSP
ncbi:hypothetical protein N7453_010429 [Penicillium expansum]|nr:hypothetical protein N7453_010429 [Penicillium expansum]